ncbi:acyltransferase family protein [Nguyenibacter sp. L1]|uniref:acyltransferase family protein n=1 Tax=Nguyenibacter sp. L1 TaxID=3049350 RepID=UPI0038D14E6D
MRFICSIFIMTHHCFIYLTNYNFLNHTHVLVDFFFLLSGFVAGNADEQKIVSGTATFGGYARHRLLRLAPLMILGVAVGSVVLIMRHPHAGAAFTAQVVLFGVLNLLLLPKFWSASGFPDYAVVSDPPLYTVLYQTAVTLFWARFLAGASTRWLVCLAIVLGIALGGVAHRVGGFNIGWGSSGAGWGYLRTGYDFVAGLVIFRFSRAILGRMPWHPAFAVLAVGTILLIVFPPFSSLPWRLATFYALPPAALILGLSAGDRRLVPGDVWLGRLSYANYVVHTPILFFVALLIGSTSNLVVIALVACLCVAVAALAMTCYDQPVSGWLRKRASLSLVARPVSGEVKETGAA